MTRITRRILLIGSIFILLSFWLWWLLRPQPLTVTTALVEIGDVEAIVANTRAGTIKACRRAKLSPAIGGKISQLPVHQGDRVKENDLLLELWNKDLAAEVDLSKSEQLTARVRIKEACLLADAAERDAARLLQLQQKKLASDDAVDRAVTGAKAKHEGCVAARAGAKSAADRVSATLAALERTQLRAPFSGIVAEVNGELGEYVTPSPPGIATLPVIDLIDNQCLYVTAPIDEVDAPAIRLGMAARITLDALPNDFFPGSVSRKAPYVLDREKQARTVEVEVAFSDPTKTRDLLTGYSADIEIIIESHKQVLRIPTEAILEGNKVWAYDKNNRRIAMRSIKTGLSNWQHTEILSGLALGDEIVTTTGREGLRSGIRVDTEQ